MKILVIGQGGREHALAWKLSQSNRVQQVYCAPSNGGINHIAQEVPFKEHERKELIHFVIETGIDLTIVGPENALLEGIVDQFEAEGLRIYGPRKGAALIEGSKSFAKDFMKKYNIPTGSYEVFSSETEAMSYLDQHEGPIVVKADGLAAGKGVYVCATVEEAKQATHDILSENKFGDAGHKVVLEEFLSGEELSLMAFVDGEVVRPMVPAQDHKPVFNGDRGLNTGGMGAYSPVPQMTEAQVQQAVDDILLPAARGLVQEGRSFSGVLYAGLMMTEKGPQVIEFNARFGDPETQVVLPRLQTDLLEIIEASLNHRLDDIDIQWKNDAAVTVVAASEGYPDSYPKGKEIIGSEKWINTDDILVFYAGVKQNDERTLQTAGGRVLAVTGMSADLYSAQRKAYEALKTIQFEGMHYRTDIADKGLKH